MSSIEKDIRNPYLTTSSILAVFCTTNNRVGSIEVGAAIFTCQNNQYEPDEEEFVESNVMLDKKTDRLIALGSILCQKQTDEFDYILEEIIMSYSPDILLCPSLFSIKLQNLPEDLTVETLPNSIFELKACEKRIDEVYVLTKGCNLSDLVYDQERSSICAIGALLYFVDQFKIAFLPKQLDDYEIEHIKSRILITYEALKSLNIFNIQKHPSQLTSSTTRKDGYSLYSLLNRVKSKIGKKKLRQWLSSPLLNVVEINCRLDLVELFQNVKDFPTDPCKVQVYDEVNNIIESLSDIKDVSILLCRICECRSKVGDWLGLVTSIYAISTVLESVDKILQAINNDLMNNPESEYKGSYKILREASRSRTVELDRVIDSFSAFDWTLSKEKGRITPKRGISEALDEYRDLYDKMDNIFKTISDQVFESYGPEIAANCTPSYLPSIGFVLLVEKSFFEVSTSNKRKHSDGAGASLPDSFELQFEQLDSTNEIAGSSTRTLKSNNEYQFYKCPITNSLDEACGDIFSLIVSFEQKIYLELEQCIQENANSVATALNNCAEIDVIIGFSLVASELDYCRPSFNNEKQAYITMMRHPLLEHNCENEYIPNTLRIDKRKRICLISGPNMSGKSAFLKSVGMIFVMAQIGCFVPAQSASLFLVDRIFTRIVSNEEIGYASTTSLTSSFGNDTKQIAKMLRFSTSDSLLLIDEYGKGTNTFDGISLLFGALEYLASDKDPPLSFCCTHFQNYLKPSSFPNSNSIFHCRMKIGFEEPDVDSYEDQNSAPIPLFLLEEGICKSSFGIACAEKSRLSNSVTERAQEILTNLEKGVMPIFSLN